jgi:4'-phosphopantetheinyl transferase
MDGRVEVHVIALDLPPDRVRALARTLDAAERDRARRLVDADAARRFTVARAALRTLLGERCGRPARALRFESDAHGRPSLPDNHGSRLTFSLSRSSERALIALSSVGPLGVDVERIEARSEDADVAASFFPPEVCAAWAALPPAERSPAFFRHWTRCEAYLKATGTGFATAAGPIRCERLAPEGDLRAFPLDLGADYAATLVAGRETRHELLSSH